MKHRLHPSRSETFPYPEREFRYHGLSIAYFDSGGSGPAVLLSHGLGANLTHFEYIAPVLHELGYRVCGLDLPGFGLSEAPHQEVSIDWLAGSMRALARHLKLERPVLGGHSLGGMLAAHLALRDPQLASALLLFSPAGLFRMPKRLGRFFRATMRPTLVAPMLEKGARGLLRVVFAQDNHRTRRFVEQSVTRPDPAFCPALAKMLWLAREELTTYHLLDDGPNIPVPTLVLWGENDRLLPGGEVAPWVRTLRDGRLEVMRRCGHMPIIEDPLAVLDATIPFLREKVPVVSRTAEPFSLPTITG